MRPTALTAAAGEEPKSTEVMLQEIAGQAYDQAGAAGRRRRAAELPTAQDRLAAPAGDERAATRPLTRPASMAAPIAPTAASRTASLRRRPKAGETRPPARTGRKAAAAKPGDSRAGSGQQQPKPGEQQQQQGNAAPPSSWSVKAKAPGTSCRPRCATTSPSARRDLERLQGIRGHQALRRARAAQRPDARAVARGLHRHRGADPPRSRPGPDAHRPERGQTQAEAAATFATSRAGSAFKVSTNRRRGSEPRRVSARSERHRRPFRAPAAA
jgi:hypothetical protein